MFRLISPRLGPEMETAIFRIVQESLSNVFRHAEARSAKVQLNAQNGFVFVCISDNGKGIDKHLEELRTGSYGIGIIGIKQRVEELGGQLVYRNTDPGTAVEVNIPVKSAKGKQKR